MAAVVAAALVIGQVSLVRGAQACIGIEAVGTLLACSMLQAIAIEPFDGDDRGFGQPRIQHCKAIRAQRYRHPAGAHVGQPERGAGGQLFCALRKTV
ncbi:hypothetical protein D3C71_1590850 [compost metagenome]